MPPIKTVGDPISIAFGGHLQVALSPTRAAGMPPIKTLVQPVEIGPPSCGIGDCIKQVCKSPIRAAGGIISSLFHAIKE
jgi:hypothetical protein